MAFFKKYNGTTNTKLIRMERLIWTLIYGGLLAVILGYFIDQQEAQDAALFYNFGGLAVAAGVVMVFIRSRMKSE